MSGDARYRLYVSDVSYYSGKLEAYVRYAGIPHERIEINTDILRETVLPATGFMKVPVLQCPDGRWLKDSTPTLEWLDREHGAPSIYPPDAAARWLALLVEDYADEWLWRPAMYYRWNFADSHILLRRRLGRELSRGTLHPAWALGWYFRWRQYLIYVRGDGVRAHNEHAVQALYRRTLAQLSRLLESRPYLLGARPSIVDFGFFASMFRHFALDPEPVRIMLAHAPAVYAWVGRLWNARADAADRSALEDFGDEGWAPVFDSIAREYLPYLDANAAAYAVGRQRFDLVLADASYPAMPVVRYRVACRERLLAAWDALDAAARARLQAQLQGSGIDGWLRAAPRIAAGLDAEFELPLQQRYPQARGGYGLRLFFGGTPWDLPAAPLARRDTDPS